MLRQHPAERWPGFDLAFSARMDELRRTPEGRDLGAVLDTTFQYGPNKPLHFGSPLRIRDAERAELTEFTAAYHRLIQTVVDRYHEDERLRHVIAVPDAIAADLGKDRSPATGRVHLMRIDTLPQPDGRLKVLETNANCPGGLIFSGHAAGRWRRLAAARGIALPAPLPAEDAVWMARWYLDLAERETGERPQEVMLLRREGGNSLELTELAQSFAALGVDAYEGDARMLRGAGGGVRFQGRPVRHAYLKLGIREFCELRDELEVFVGAVGRGELFVQNGQRGRWIGDNKLCLAALSDPGLAPLFDPRDYDLVKDAIPWSRNVALCSADLLDTIARNPADYVLKRPLDTRGRGVLVGREAREPGAWRQALEHAVKESWLVQEHCPMTVIHEDGRTVAHDLALGAVDGRLSATLVRSSAEHLLNVARSGLLHPVFL